MIVVGVKPQNGPPEHDLRRVVHGHAELVALIAEHARKHAREAVAAAEARDHADMAGSAAGTGTM